MVYCQKMIGFRRPVDISVLASKRLGALVNYSFMVALSSGSEEDGLRRGRAGS